MGGLLGAVGGGVIGGAVVKLYLDDKQYRAGLAEAEASGKGAATGIGSTFARLKVLGAAAFALLGVAAIKFAKTAITAASDLAESQNKVKVVFGQSADVIDSFGKTSAASFGISEQGALEAASSYGNMLQTAGLTQQAAADMSVSLVQLAADMASFNNQDPTEMLAKLQSGLAGQARPLRTVGVLLSESRVKAEAYSSGIAKVGTELTDAQKVQTRYNIIMKDTAIQQGDFARTSNGLANQQRILKATFEDLTASIGKVLIPVMTTAAQTVINLSHNFGELLAPALVLVLALVPKLVTAFEGFQAAIAAGLVGGLGGIAEALAGIASVNPELLAAGLAKLGDALQGTGANDPQVVKLTTDINAAAAAFTTMYAAFNPLVGTSDAATSALNGLGFEMQRVKAGTDTVAGSLVSVNAALEPLGLSLTQTDWQALIDGGAKGQEVAKRLAFDIGSATGALNGFASHIGSAGHAVENFAGMTGAALKTWRADFKKAISGVVYDLGNLSSNFGVTQKQFNKASHAMEARARLFNGAMSTLAGKSENWVPQDYVKFLADQGPGYVVAFAGETQASQRKAVAAWKGTNSQARGYGSTIDGLTGKIKNIPETKSIKVNVFYNYLGYDPTKPIPGH